MTDKKPSLSAQRAAWGAFIKTPVGQRHIERLNERIRYLNEQAGMSDINQSFAYTQQRVGVESELKHLERILSSNEN